MRALRVILGVGVLSAATWFLVPGSVFTLTAIYVIIGLLVVVRGRAR